MTWLCVSLSHLCTSLCFWTLCFTVGGWESKERFVHIKCGLGTIVPLSFLQNTFSINDIELKLCGQPIVDVRYLKLHTIYQVGITNTDQHIQFFWAALESFSQEELGKFIKFACNQDRIPMVSQENSNHIPPYPMKIAPPDRRDGMPDQQFIRVETCMFMIKLPRYTTFETMREKLIYAISCALDPLSGWYVLITITIQWRSCQSVLYRIRMYTKSAIVPVTKVCRIYILVQFPHQNPKMVAII